MAQLYCVSAHNPTRVSHSLTCSFTSAEQRNLVIAKTSRLEVHVVSTDGLHPVCDINVYGRIATLSSFRLPVSC